MADWTTLDTNGLLPGEPLTSEKALAFYNNPIAIAERAAGAPAIFGVPYDYQEFTSSGTWNKPAGAVSGDEVLIQVVGAGGSGAYGQAGTGTNGGGGQGGAGIVQHFDNIDDFDSSHSVVVGAGGAGQTTVGNDGNAGGFSSFGTAGVPSLGVSPIFLRADGGAGGLFSGASSSAQRVSFGRTTNAYSPASGESFYKGGNGGDPNNTSGGHGVCGGGGGGGVNTSNGSQGGFSVYAGRGGQGTDTIGVIDDYDIDGVFPGGGGGGVYSGLSGETRTGNGAAGVVRVWCIRNA